jgi:hypothetical protein
MQTDVKAVFADATATVVSARSRVKGIVVIPGATAGNIILRDGGSSGVNRLQIAVTTDTTPFSVMVPGQGILFDTDVHATLPTAVKVTVFYG